MLTYKPLEKEYSLFVSLKDSDKLKKFLKAGRSEAVLLDIIEEITPILAELSVAVEVKYIGYILTKITIFINIEGERMIFDITGMSKETALKYILTDLCNSI